MRSRLRKFILTTHIVFSVGWLGAVVAYLVLALTGLNSQDIKIVNAVYLSMELIGWRAIVPLCLAAFLSGVIQALVTPWGLFRHFWIVTKLGLTAISTFILLKHMPTVSRMASMVQDAQSSSADFGIIPKQLVIHAGGGLLVLLVITVISVYKPWGMTSYGRRKQK